MLIPLPTEVIPQSEMTRTKWIAYRWQDVRTITDKEGMYVCCGIRRIEEAEEAGRDFDIWRKSMTHEYKFALKTLLESLRNEKITFRNGGK